MTRAIDRELVQLLDRVEGGDSTTRIEACGRMTELVMHRRTSLLKRGSPSHAAESPIPPERLRSAVAVAVEDADPRARAGVVTVAGELGDSQVVPLLVSRLDDDDVDVRIAAVNALADVGGPQAVGALARAAADKGEDPDVRLAALSELDNLVSEKITSGPDRRFD